MSTGSMLLREYLQRQESKVKDWCHNNACKKEGEYGIVPHRYVEMKPVFVKMRAAIRKILHS